MKFIPSSYIWIGVLLTFVACRAEPADVVARVPSGLWKEPDSGLLVRTHPCVNRSLHLCGTIVGVPQGAEAMDVNNPDPRLRGRTLLNLEMVRDFEAVSLNRWQGGGDFGRRPGRIYLPLNGDTLGDHKNRYEIEFEKDRLVVRVADCQLMNCLTKSVWKRVE